MPLLLDPSVLPLDQLRKMARELSKGLSGMAEWALDPKLPVREPLGVLSAADLFRAAAVLGALADDDRATAARLVAVVNVQYEAMIAGIDLVKMHCEMPKVPRASAPKTPTAARRREGGFAPTRRRRSSQAG